MKYFRHLIDSDHSSALAHTNKTTHTAYRRTYSGYEDGDGGELRCKHSLAIDTSLSLSFSRSFSFD